MNKVIKVENLSKKFTISSSRHSEKLNFRELMEKNVRSLFSLHKTNQLRIEELWALKDINFEIEAGARVGIVGRNGAGKSTLLKILSRVIAPDSGTAKIKGRLLSLLEVGTGFHAELTGRENIFLNGAILGMKRWEIQKRFDEIVSFAEIGAFLDTPIKRYSSGMSVRLAFSVAAHFEPDVMILDEVLAVGDTAFQKKCLRKIEDISNNEGKTILFVSHNMHVVKNLCTQALFLKEGAIVSSGNTNDIVSDYLQTYSDESHQSKIQDRIAQLPEDEVFKLKGIQLSQEGIAIGETVESGKDLNLEIKYNVKKRCEALRLFFDLVDESENLIFRSFHDTESKEISSFEVGDYVSVAKIPANFLAPRSYKIKVYATIFNVRNIYSNSIDLIIHVENSGTLNPGYIMSDISGSIYPLIRWNNTKW